jgi:hypothetical protein
MLETFRSFEVTDPFDRRWDVEFGWQQNGISIRHADTVDVKFFLSRGDEKLERVVALQNSDLLTLAANAGRSVSDAWCMKLAALHLEHMISTWEDMEKTLVTVPYTELLQYNKALEEVAAAPRH